MTRQEIMDTYDINEQGVITNPGKFEGEMLYVPYFWDAYMNGNGDWEDDFTVFTVEPDDISEFPELMNTTFIKLYEDDQGFVSEI